MNLAVQTDEEKKSQKPTSAYRKLRRRLSKTILRAPRIWLCHRGLRPTDVFFASYPRSGTTWSRFTLYEILTGGEASFTTVNDVIRPVYSGRGKAILPENDRLIHTHEPYHKEYQRAIYLVRDPRDVLLSEFAYTTALEFFQGDLDEFVATFLYGRVNPFGAWPQHIDSWLDSPIANSSDFMLVRYEDLRRNPQEGFGRMAEFLGVNPGPDLIQRAIVRNTVDKMKEKERNEPQRASAKGEFVRSGSVQGWRAKLSASHVALVQKYAGEQLLRLGYN